MDRWTIDLQHGEEGTLIRLYHNENLVASQDFNTLDFMKLVEFRHSSYELKATGGDPLSCHHAELYGPQEI